MWREKKTYCMSFYFTCPSGILFCLQGNVYLFEHQKIQDIMVLVFWTEHWCERQEMLVPVLALEQFTCPKSVCPMLPKLET